MLRQDRIPKKGSREQDALTRRKSIGWRQFLRWRPGVRKFWKRKYNRRVRRLGRKA